MRKILFYLLFIIASCFAQTPDGYRNISWGSSVAQVREALPSGKNLTQITNSKQNFPVSLNIARYQLTDSVAGYPAKTELYFYDDKFFQAVIDFNFNRFKNYDFNYNVFISVDKYYNDIRATTLNFVADIYALLAQKYGKKEPTFKGLDPRSCFTNLDNYLAKERWNLRYNPSEYYKQITTQSYAQWKFPKTEVRFSVIISAFDKRFEYTLSLAGNDLLEEIEKSINNERSGSL
ncbi:MAG: hypothetical protein LBH98_02260 [Chitinispirillales bacterium]|jgi:hypothetical protein|nr:hypothetical protein [Chitinispirillales bacterium]